ncbi:MAG TPA: hypothetical protein VMU14_09360 [Acidimicrobiales bacterium]|nr:hypothetical protein [Acidimicrobiales bacterium]
MSGGTSSLPDLPVDRGAPGNGSAHTGPGARTAAAHTAGDLTRETLALLFALAMVIYATVELLQEWAALWRRVRRLVDGRPGGRGNG